MLLVSRDESLLEKITETDWLLIREVPRDTRLVEARVID